MVDDEIEVCRLVTQIMEASGYEVIATTSAEEALQLVSQEKPDLIISDVSMPVMDGFELCRRVRANSLLENVPFFFLTALDDLPAQVHGFEIGADEYITKPFELELLEARVEALFRRVALYEQRALTDPLTGLHNRRFFDERLAVELGRAARHVLTFSVAIIDIDHFKRVNDKHGHEVGDKVLQEVAEVLRAAFREEDSIARYGGEEFAALMVGASRREAFSALERVRRGVEDRSLQHPGTESTIIITVSAGAATYPEDSRTAEGLLRRADNALYQAKRAGRNRVRVDPESPGSSDGLDLPPQR